MGYGNYGGYTFGPNGLQMPNDEGYDQSVNPFEYMDPNGIQGAGMGMMGGSGQFKNFNKAMGTPLGRMGANAIMGMANGQNFGQAATGAAMDFGKSALMKYGTKQLLGGALGGQAAGFLGGPWGMAAMAAMPYLSKGFSSLGKSLGIGKHSGPSAQQVAMGEAKNNLMGMRGTYGADMGAGQALRDKYNPMLEAQIGKMQELADRGLSTEYNTRQMAGAAAQTEAARRAAEARMKATSGMIGGGQAVAGFGGINAAAVGGAAQGSYNAAQTNMNSQPGYIQAIAGMAGQQIGRGDNYYNQGRSGMMGLDQNMYNLNAQEKARADAISQQNRDREANMIGGVMNMAGTAAGMEQSRKQNRDYMNALFPGAGSNGNSAPNRTSGFNGMPVTADGQPDYDLMRSQGMISTVDDMPPAQRQMDTSMYMNPDYQVPITGSNFSGSGWGYDPMGGRQWMPGTGMEDPSQNYNQSDDGWAIDPSTGQRYWRGY